MTQKRLTSLLVGIVLALGLSVPAMAQETVTPGAFCAAGDEGERGQTVTGLEMECTTTDEDDRLRWREAGAPEETEPAPAGDDEGEAEEEVDEQEATPEEAEEPAAAEDDDEAETEAPARVDAGLGGAADGGVPAYVLVLMLAGLMLATGGIAFSRR